MIGREIEQEREKKVRVKEEREEKVREREERRRKETGAQFRRGGTAKLLIVDTRPTIKSYNSNSIT